MDRKRSKEGGGPSADKITDARFSSFQTDPRFRGVSKRKHKTPIGKRFSRALLGKDFTESAKVDKYGRKLKSDNKRKVLQRLYRLEDEDDAGDQKDEKPDDDEAVRQELRRVDKDYDPARGGGFSTSESEDDDSDSDGSEPDQDGEEELDVAADMQRFQDEQADVPTGEVTNRIAVVNLDWDHIKSVDLFAMFASFVPSDGRIDKISIYPSEFGKQRMQREELEGPPKEIFKSRTPGDTADDDTADDSGSEGGESDEEDEEDDEDDEAAKRDLLQEGNDEDFNSDALRSYQLDRLRYYYAVVVCGDKHTAEAIYQATDGKEFQASSNFVDLRFVPDEVTFDDEPRDACTSVPTGYKPVDFVTDALQHSKVKLTWDMHPEEVARKDTIKRAFTGSRDDIAENDLRAYLASDSDEDDDAEELPTGEEADEPRLTKKELARRKMREALGLGDEPAPKASEKGPVGGMQVKFVSALSEKNATDEVEETTVQKYMRKEKERKERRRQKAQAEKPDSTEDAHDEAQDDLGFDDPFFTQEEPTEKTKTSMRKEERKKKRAAREAEEKEGAEQRAQLELIMADDDGPTHHRHFDMKEIIRAEKQKGKKKTKDKKADERGGLQEDFTVDVQDPRFSRLFESHEFAINPSERRFEKTAAVQKLLEESRKRGRGGEGDDEDHGHRERQPKKAKKASQEPLAGLAQAVKNKSKSRR